MDFKKLEAPLFLSILSLHITTLCIWLIIIC